jgi:septal ring factor EnvC (AmiA/AmiB activator)
LKGDILYPPQAAVGKPGAAPKAGGAKGKKDPNANMEEVLLELVQDLRAELRQRDQEYEQLRDSMRASQEAQKHLAYKLMEEKEARQTIEAKLNKLRILKEIDENYSKIERNEFFENKTKNTKNQRAVLFDSVSEQFKLSQQKALAMKYAHLWLQYV